MSGLSLFVCAPGRKDVVVELEIHATVGDLLEQYKLQTGQDQVGSVLWGGEVVRDMQATLADLGICSQSHVQLQAPFGHWVYNSASGRFYSKGGVILLHPDSGAFLELNATSNGWFRWSEKRSPTKRRVVHSSEQNKVWARMAWSGSCPSEKDFQVVERTDVYLALLSNLDSGANVDTVDSLFSEGPTFVLNKWTFHKFDWGVVITNLHDGSMRLVLRLAGLCVLPEWQVGWKVEDNKGYTLSIDEWMEMNSMLGPLAVKDTRAEDTGAEQAAAPEPAGPLDLEDLTTDEEGGEEE
eukprot:Hpha_TRINITY_DN2922_c0_g1::TRINITY_DN2922_c0_g1_i2::g.19642::m.19642